MENEVRRATQRAVHKFNEVMRAQLSQAEVDEGVATYKAYWLQGPGSEKYSWTPLEYESPGFQLKFVNKWLGEPDKDRVLEWFRFFSDVYDERLKRFNGRPGTQIRLRLFLLGAGPSVEIFALVLYLASKLQDDILIEVHAFDIADWSNTTRILLESFASMVGDDVVLDSQEADGMLDQCRVVRAFSRIQTVSHFNGRELVSPEVSSAHSSRRSRDINDASDRADICAAIKQSEHDPSSVVNIMCLSHVMSHCSEEDCAFLRRFQGELGGTAQIDLFLCEEHPRFRSALGGHARDSGQAVSCSVGEAESADRFADSIADGWIGRRVREGYKGCKQQGKAASNMYFYTNFCSESPGASCAPAQKLHKAELAWEQFLYGRPVEERLKLEELLQLVQSWSVAHAATVSAEPWLLKRLAHVAARGKKIRDILDGKQLRGPSYDKLVELVTAWQAAHIALTALEPHDNGLPRPASTVLDDVMGRADIHLPA